MKLKVVSGDTIKSKWFRHMPDNSWRMPESFWKLLGIFWKKNRKCSGTAGTASDEITKLELFQNALKIILVGTGIVLSPHKYFQFERTLKNVVVNSDGRFWIFWKSTFGIFPKRLLEGMG